MCICGIQDLIKNEDFGSAHVEWNHKFSVSNEFQDGSIEAHMQITLSSNGLN